MTESEEIWKPVLGYEGYYEVSNKGRVKSVRTRTNSKTGTHLKQHDNLRGYKFVALCKMNKVEVNTVHKLVAAAFIGKRPDSLVVNHIDGNKLNNKIENLEYVTYSQNTQHGFDIGLMPQGEKHWRAFLTERDIIEIRKLKNLGIMQKDIAKKFNVSTQHMSDIVNGKYWKSVK